MGGGGGWYSGMIKFGLGKIFKVFTGVGGGGGYSCLHYANGQ